MLRDTPQLFAGMPREGSELIQEVCPVLNELHPLMPIPSSIVDAPRLVFVLVRSAASITSGLKPRSLRMVLAAERKPWAVISNLE